MQPTLEEWLALPRTELAALVLPKNLTVNLSVDGTRRHYLIHTKQNNIASYSEYAAFEGAAYARVYDLLFGLGVQTVLTSVLYPPNFQRSAAYLEKSVAMSELIFLGPVFKELYQKWQVAARFYGDFEFAPAAQAISQNLQNLAATLKEKTPFNDRLLLLGYNAGSFNEEMIFHSLKLHSRLNRPPTEQELKAAIFPYGPAKIDLYIGAGGLTVGKVLPPILDEGTSLYYLAFLALDLQENTLRRILYDYLFARQMLSDDFTPYTEKDLQDLGDYYAEHADCLVGLGKTVGPGIWYADHH